MVDQRTTASVQRYLVALTGDNDPDPIVRALLSRAARRLQFLCANMLQRQYPRLMRPPTNVQHEEMLGLLVERMLKAMRKVKPRTVREFFALANQHLRWELNEFARQLASRPVEAPLPDNMAIEAPDVSSAEAACLGQIMAAIERLPDETRETFCLVHIQGLTHAETSEVLGVSTKTVQRRLQMATHALANELSGLGVSGSGAFNTDQDSGPGVDASS
jgi:RNA polymerase sigma-70 factor (ECF subfamily)